MLQVCYKSSCVQGVLKVNQIIELRPGILGKDASGNLRCSPIYTRVASLHSEQNKLQIAVPGGLIGVGTTMDPALSRSDRLVGQVLGQVGTLPEVYTEIKVSRFKGNKLNQNDSEFSYNSLM